ncbi:Ribosomal RNA adenine dimethylase [Phycisphaerae bacterium RAS1]|nr:Ribosomal RNA adenine dimethylase [Phycisphaerae bacterium RAS1]
MQTLSDIRALLADAGLSPQHRFGQNFLIDLNLMRKLVAAAELSPDDVVLEVGPGTGSLTELLLDSGARVLSVEIDRGLQAILRARLGDHSRFTLLQGDALAAKTRVNPQITQILAAQPPGRAGAYKLVANLPYQIATPLLMDLLYGRPRFERLCCTIQREVGERLSAAPSTDAYGPVSVIVQSLARIEPIAILPPTVFWPRPEVESIMLTLRPLPDHQIEVDDVPAFVALVRGAFQQRRKMLRRLLADRDELSARRIFAAAGVSPDARAENLTPLSWRCLFAAIRRHPA